MKINGNPAYKWPKSRNGVMAVMAALMAKKNGRRNRRRGISNGICVEMSLWQCIMAIMAANSNGEMKIEGI
jgi:hypothetical protein